MNTNYRCAGNDEILSIACHMKINYHNIKNKEKNDDNTNNKDKIHKFK